MRYLITIFFFTVIAMLIGGCGGERRSENVSNNVPAFANVYKALIADEEKSIDLEASPKTITLNIKDMPMKEFLTHVSELTDISVISEDNLDEKLVSIDVVDTSIDEVLSAVARRFGVDIITQGDLYYLGQLSSIDRGFLVRKVRRLSAENIEKIVSSMNSDVGRAFVNSDGLIVVADSLRVLKQINNMLNHVERLPANSWILQMYLITTTDKKTREYGFDVTADYDASLITELDTSAALRNTSKIVADGEFRAILRAARNSSHYNILAEPMMLLVDGGKASIRDGEKIPIAQTTVSDSGTVSITGYDIIDTGILVSAGLREMSPSSASCDLEIEITQVTGYNESYPVTSGQTFSSTTILESGGTYLVGSISKKSSAKESSGIVVNTLQKGDVNNVTMSIWLRCYRIKGAYDAKKATSTSHNDKHF